MFSKNQKFGMFYNTVRRKKNQWKNSLYCSVTSENNTSTKVAAHILDYQYPKLYNWQVST